MTPRRHIIAWDRDAQAWTVVDARSKAVAGSFPTLLAAEEWVCEQDPKDAS